MTGSLPSQGGESSGLEARSPKPEQPEEEKSGGRERSDDTEDSENALEGSSKDEEMREEQTGQNITPEVIRKAGEQLFPLVYEALPPCKPTQSPEDPRHTLAMKVTGMLIEDKAPERWMQLINNPGQLGARVEECSADDSRAGEEGGEHR